MKYTGTYVVDESDLKYTHANQMYVSNNFWTYTHILNMCILYIQQAQMNAYSHKQLMYLLLQYTSWCMCVLKITMYFLAICLKGQLPEIFGLGFISESSPPWTLIQCKNVFLWSSIIFISHVLFPAKNLVLEKIIVLNLESRQR